MTRRSLFATLPASVRAINPTVKRNSAQGRTAKRNGAVFEREVFAALAGLQSAGVLAWWSHTSPDSKRLRDGRTIIAGRALCDVVGCTADGRSFVAEVKTSVRRVEIAAHDRGGVQPHQAAQLTATACAGGVSLLVAQVAGVAVVIPWGEASALVAVTPTIARAWAASSLSVAIIGAMVPRPVKASGTPAAGVVATSGRPEASSGAAEAPARRNARRRGA
jgi:hypothetical protein